VASWADLSRTPERAGVFLDFDGTLSTIVVDAADARPVPGATEVLVALAARYRSVAVVSGRPVDFLFEHVGLAGTAVRAFGHYGLEWTDGDRIVTHPDAAPWRDAVAGAVDAAVAAAPDGVSIERKGLSVVLHARPAPEHDAWARRFAEAEAAARGLALSVGRLAYELRPPVDVDKGTVVAQLLLDVDTACFIGDDRGDVLAFDALDRFAADGGTGFKVAVRSDEAPAELLERADDILDGPVAVVAALRGLL